MTPNDEGTARVAKFMHDLEAIPWFANLGAPIPPSCGVNRISQWEEWLGPESEGATELAMRHQALHDEIMAGPEENRELLSKLWIQIQDWVIELAGPKVPYDSKEDCYHAPTAAVWQAACTAALVGLCLRLQRPVPDEVSDQWKWFVQGHWPCAYAYADANEQPGPLVVF
jgi:hypothetical protein